MLVIFHAVSLIWCFLFLGGFSLIRFLILLFVFFSLPLDCFSSLSLSYLLSFLTYVCSFKSFIHSLIFLVLSCSPASASFKTSDRQPVPLPQSTFLLESLPICLLAKVKGFYFFTCVDKQSVECLVRALRCARQANTGFLTFPAAQLKWHWGEVGSNWRVAA